MHDYEKGSPEDVFWDYVWGYLLDEFDRVAANVAPEELRLFQAQVLEGLSHATPRQLERHIRGGFGPGTSRNHLRSLSPQEFFVLFLRASARRSGRDGLSSKVESTEIRSCEVVDDIATIEWSALLSVGREVVLVEKRVGLRHSHGRWWILLDERVANMGSRIRAELEEDNLD